MIDGGIVKDKKSVKTNKNKYQLDEELVTYQQPYIIIHPDQLQALLDSGNKINETIEQVRTLLKGN